MAAGQWNLLLEQRADYRPVITYTDSTGAAVNLSGWTAKLQIRASYAATAVMLELSTTAKSITLGSDGTIRPVFTAALTGTLTVGGLALSNIDNLGMAAQIGVYDLLLTDLSGTVTRLLEGPCYLAPGVTQ
jgi:hypothetical protein